MPQPDAALANYETQQRISAGVLVLARRLWAKLGRGDFDEAWRILGPQLLVVLAAGQRAAATQAVAYVPSVLDELGVDPAPDGQVVVPSLVGVASDCRDLASLLYEPIVATRVALAGGSPIDAALDAGRSALDLIVQTQVADAGRAAEQMATVARPRATKYVRMLVLPSCSRCAVLAGRAYWNLESFQRHPRCDCRMVPCSENVAGDLTTDPLEAIKSGQVHGLSGADLKAIVEDGADPAKVINAQFRAGKSVRGAQVLGQKLKVTTEGTGRAARKRGDAMVEAVGTDGRKFWARLRPDAIYKLAAGDRDEALRLLKLYGFIT